MHTVPCRLLRHPARAGSTATEQEDTRIAWHFLSFCKFGRARRAAVPPRGRLKHEIALPRLQEVRKRQNHENQYELAAQNVQRNGIPNGFRFARIIVENRYAVEEVPGQ